ncbi:50S ribosomal protein L21 [Mesorhizobium sp. SEMIA 3007]|jgi:large subunit ribosomal protein L21|uniref:Large ribosomal subunit protein bL21 n=6 Tax=Mesorhizobium TaxID=68287 RepID=RL21_RHILO|nr:MULTISPECIES: 50S ribosomal protein L21 [Mesorhizobium]Q98EY9.1 RecName: Full=Large ribosomal subunit protein bL21; AltName: Full=50S ribosomal protein L21 [Mesorhizobium japonicum MAFF 303099]AID33117.1 50S ribosomal protein L21 [Mesorhizobium huakuii 7653R]ANN61272.1 50S ribosomal protein L21 [Mesorhizobium loti NZP2037]MBE1707396.1 50S ribosomal protein L21 [Mesorhizobium japonicum]MBE1715705.1 50S ribosomal protein L21 [Mesorhizobium japonicum]MCH4557423.1 50S ribosomal protein L21 [Me
MFAVIKTGGKQYRVAANDLLKIEKVEANVGDIVEIGHVLAHGEGENVTFGAPFVDGALVTAEVVEQGKNRTVIAFKKRRRQNSRRKIGHRQLLTTVRISEILLGGAKPAKKAAVKAEAKAEVAAEAAPKEAKAKKEAAPKADVTAETAAAPLFKAPKGEPDDLTVIKGIGPVAAKDLNEQGIITFAQLAKLTDKDVAKIDEHMPFSADQIKDWREQAKELAKK